MGRRLIWLLLCVPVSVLACVALVGAAGASGASSPARVGRQTFTVNVDGANKSANEAFLAYYPSVVRVHPGDAVVFDEVGNGEPHTVTLGTLTDQVVAAFDKLTPLQQQQAPPASLLRLDAKVPFLLPRGPGDAIQSAANPCFLDTGVPSSKAPCANCENWRAASTTEKLRASSSSRFRSIKVAAKTRQ